MNKTNSSIVTALVVSLSSSVWASTPQEVYKQLQQFNQNPVQFMNQKVVKKAVRKGKTVTIQQPAFSNSQRVVNTQLGIIFDKNAGDKAKARTRTKLRSVRNRVALPGRAGIAANDRPSQLVDKLTMTTLEAIEANKLTEANLAESPWSDDYWAIDKGILAYRYLDAQWSSKPAGQPIQKPSKWIEVKTAYDTNPGYTDVNTLSPAEKYDYLVGDANFSMRKSNVEAGEEYFRDSGKVETWMGICHGWAPAAYMMDRPTTKVVTTVPDLKDPSKKVELTFYPSDIKALESLLWANASPGNDRFIGGRCDTKDGKIKMDKENGRILDEECFDTNPGSFHLALVNQIGSASKAAPGTPASKRAFVMDATFDTEVWNQPVYGYKYTYFNPQTGKPVASLAEAKVKMSDYAADKFKKYRSPKAVAAVGVSLAVSYVVETQPSGSFTDSAKEDAITQAEYMYDLELNDKGEVIGGEWYQNGHPDFVWTPAAGAKAKSNPEYNNPITWKVGQPISPAIKRMAVQASSNSQPLAAIVEGLLNASNKK